MEFLHRHRSWYSRVGDESGLFLFSSVKSSLELQPNCIVRYENDDWDVLKWRICFKGLYSSSLRRAQNPCSRFSPSLFMFHRTHTHTHTHFILLYHTHANLLSSLVLSLSFTHTFSPTLLGTHIISFFLHTSNFTLSVRRIFSEDFLPLPTCYFYEIFWLLLTFSSWR